MIELLKRGAADMCIPLSEGEVLAFVRFSEELKKWGSKINLTSLLDDEMRMVEELFLDSLAPLKVMSKAPEKEVRLLDIGAGGGFPGIPIKIAKPYLLVTLTDSKTKKVQFMKHVVRVLSLSDIEARQIRFGDKGGEGLDRGIFDLAISKAVADLKRLGRWAAPHLKMGGQLICMKGINEELIPLDGYCPPERFGYSLPFTGAKRELFMYERI